MDIADQRAYLKKIGLSHKPEVSQEGLISLHHQHFFSLPFENFDIQLGKTIHLDPSQLFDKLVNHHRGGYCFELNGLLLIALQTFGFKATRLLARVHLSESPGALTHQINIVDVGGQKWLVDAGFGAGSPREPIPLVEGVHAVDEYHQYALEQCEPWGWLLKTNEKGIWKESYSFHFHHYLQVDFDLGNHYTSTSPHTHFTQIRTASIPTHIGRISLNNFTLTVVENGVTHEELIPDTPAYLKTLQDYFGIQLEVPYHELLHSR